MSDKRFKDCIVLDTLSNGTARQMAYHGFLIERSVYDGQTYYSVTVPKTYDLIGAIRDLIDDTIAYGVQIGNGTPLKHNRDCFYQKANEIGYHCGTRHHVPVESIHDNNRSGRFFKEFRGKVDAFDWIDEHRQKFTPDYNLNPLADLQKQYRDLWWTTVDKLQDRDDVSDKREEANDLRGQIKELQDQLDEAEAFEYKGETLVQEQEVS